MGTAGTHMHTISELGEFASFTVEEQRYIESSLDIALGSPEKYNNKRKTIGLTARCAAYRELRTLRKSIPTQGTFAGVDAFMGSLLRITAQDLARGRLVSFSAYRFLYERLLGAAIRPWLPAAFCGAAALPQIAPSRRRQLLQSLTESAVTAPDWCSAEPRFYPRGFDAQPDSNQVL